MSKFSEFREKYPILIAAVKLAFFLYIFILSLQLMGDSLKLFGKGFSESLIAATDNPFVGLFIGILATSIVQSSSSTTSIVVGLVAGGALNIDTAVPIIMGANIGTSITNTIASIPQMNRSNEFQRAFAAATVHDFFNFLAVIVFFPLEYFTHFLRKSAYWLEKKFEGLGGLDFLNPVKAITKPVVAWIHDVLGSLTGSDDITAWIALALSLALLFFALKNMVSTLKGVVIERAKELFDKYLFKNSIRAFGVGILLTILVQSSSITTSLVVPLAGAGLLTLMQIFPYTLGSNIGTTFTAILAALVTGSDVAISVAFAHLLFNICGIIIWWPLKIVPVTLALKFSEYSAKTKAVPIIYLAVMFFIIPLLVMYLA